MTEDDEALAELIEVAEDELQAARAAVHALGPQDRASRMRAARRLVDAAREKNRIHLALRRQWALEHLRTQRPVGDFAGSWQAIDGDPHESGRSLEPSHLVIWSSLK